MIVSGGENVFPREVEDLLADHEAIEEAAVVGVPDEEFGQRLKAFVVLRDGAELSEDDVQGLRQGTTSPATRCRARSCSSSELPRNATGKVLKRELQTASAGACRLQAGAVASLGRWPQRRHEFDLARAAPEPRRGPAAGRSRCRSRR